MKSHRGNRSSAHRGATAHVRPPGGVFEPAPDSHRWRPAPQVCVVQPCSFQGPQVKDILAAGEQPLDKETTVLAVRNGHTKALLHSLSPGLLSPQTSEASM